jgi:hypothetical protein
MTSLPIIYFSVFDMEYQKNYDQTAASPSKVNRRKFFMTNPSLYKIGI